MGVCSPWNHPWLVTRFRVRLIVLKYHQDSIVCAIHFYWKWLFFNPNHDFCFVERGYLADKDGPPAPEREYSILGSWLTGGAIFHWPIAFELHNSVPAQLSPFLGWVAYIFLTAIFSWLKKMKNVSHRSTVKAYQSSFNVLEVNGNSQGTLKCQALPITVI